MIALAALAGPLQATILGFNGIAGGNNAAVPASFGSNLSSDIPGATVSNGATPDIALTWAGGGSGGWDLHGGGGSAFWAALDSDIATTPSIAQMESPTAASANTITFTVDAGQALRLNSVDIGMATDKTATYYWDVTISELGGVEVFSTLTAAMDGDGGSGVQALTINLNFTGTLGTDYVLAFNDVDSSGNDTISTNGGAIDNLSFSQVAAGPDLTDPELSSVNPLNPADDATNVAAPSNLGVTFNEFIVLATGNITLRESSGGAMVETFDVDTSSRLQVSGSSLTIYPSNNMAPATSYYVEIDASAVDDLAGNSFAGISDPTIWNFTTDATNPVVGTLDTPSNGATGVSVDSSLDLTFSEDVQIGSGNIVIRRSSDNSIVDTINVTSGGVTVTGALVSITPNIILPAQTELYVEVAAGVFIDLSGNSFAGISGPGTWSFTTGAAPVPFRMTIVLNGPDFDFSWTSKPGRVYDLLSSTDLSTPSDSWPVYGPDGPDGNDPYGNVPSAGTTTTLTSVPTDGPRRFFVMREKKQVLVEAHRGYSQIAPENTVAAIDAAADSADLVEFDVRITSDGELVLMHDGTVNRTTDGSGSVSSLTLAQIQLLDAGSWFSAAFAGEPVPTMAEAINACLAAGIVPLIERKAGAASDYHAEFVSLGLDPSEFRVISFSSGFLADLDTLNPDYRLGLLGGGTITQSVIDNLKSMGIDFLDWGYGAVDQAAVDLVHANGMELHVYTVNDSARMQELIDYGVDGITTDNPVLLRSLLP